MMLSVPIDGQVQSRLIPPTFVEDNISDMFKLWTPDTISS